MLGEKDDLTDVIGVMRHLAIQRLDDAQRLAADGDFEQDVFFSEGVERLEQHRPPALPVGHHRLTRGPAGNLEFTVAVAVGLLAVAGEEVGEPRPQVARHVLDDDGQAVRLRIECHQELVVADLGQGVLRQFLQPAKLNADVVEIGEWHWTLGSFMAQGSGLTAQGRASCSGPGIP